MAGAWQSAAAMQRLATWLLACALAGIAVVYAANQKSVTLQGPGTLRAVDTGTLWLGVNEELWVLDRDGRRRARHPVRAFGLHEGISNIVPTATGEVLLTSRGDREWQLVDRTTVRPVRSIRPQWPPEFEGNVRAIHLAVAPSGDIAAGTGGNHAVLLFDREGRLKARTRAGTYRFTNGLWWSADGWWTTDTNRFALHLLDAQTLAVKRTVPLEPAPAGYPFLAEAVPSGGQARATDGEAPLATLTRVGYLMEPGHAVDVFPDGSQRLFNIAPFRQLRDITWFGGHLLAVEGASFTLQRFAADRQAQGEFGAPEVRAELQQMRADRDLWRAIGSRYALLLSAALLAAGIAAHVRHKRLAARGVVAAREGGKAAATGVPLRRRALQGLGIFGLPVLVRMAAALVGSFLLFPLLQALLLKPSPQWLFEALSLLLLCTLAPVLPVAIWQERRHARIAADPHHEAVLNHRAIAWLRDHTDFDAVKLPGEAVRETVYVTGLPRRWLLITDRRVLLFTVSARERRLARAWPRRAVTAAGVPAAGPAWRHWLWRQPNLWLRFATGKPLFLACASAVTARRVAELLNVSPASPEAAAAAAAASGAVARRRWREPLASLLWPGTGQWLQGRFTTGTVLFTAAVLLAIFGWWPVVWALQGPKMEVSAASIVSAAAAWVLLALAAGSDAWRFSATRPVR